MARTTPAAVQAILRPGTQGGDYDDVNAPDLSPYIDTASAIVDDIVTYAAQRRQSIAASKLELIERWLAAWAYALSDQPYASRSTKSASGSFQGQTGMGLDANHYGQAAKRLDTTGILAALDKRQTATMRWLGKTTTEQIPIWERD